MEALFNSKLFPHRSPEPQTLKYGTAGFRMKANYIAPIAARLGTVFEARAAELLLLASGNNNNNNNNENQMMFFGVMITASHNAACDNGLKIVEPPTAHMLGGSGEANATALARTTNSEEFKAVQEEIMKKASSSSSSSSNWHVLVGWDTRESGVEIADALELGIQAVSGGRAKVIRIGQVTTPMLHWAVEQINQAAAASKSEKENESQVMSSATQIPSKYLKFLCDTFADALPKLSSSSSQSPKNRHLIVDCANGVGTDAMKMLSNVLICNETISKHVKYSIELINTDTATAEALNDTCGADYVQKNLQLPKNLSAEQLSEKSKKQQEGEGNGDCIFYSLDGDADRLVAGAINNKASGAPPMIFEGDRFTALFATGITTPSSSSNKFQGDISLGAVQTAYANGASTTYLRKCAGGILKTEFALTGVKYVHAAAEKYDIGIYFESNGHGTVLHGHKQKALSAIKASSAAALAIAELCSQSCGDAIANLLATEVALIALNWSTQQWIDIYTDLPCVQKKVPANTSLFQCVSGNEQKLSKPEGMQVQVDKCVAARPGARAFVRPSGTEPVVRLYVEANSAAEAQALTDDLEKLVVAVGK